MNGPLAHCRGDYELKCALFSIKKEKKYDLASGELKDIYKNINRSCSQRLQDQFTSTQHWSLNSHTKETWKNMALFGSFDLFVAKEEKSSLH